jgi:hypothetical protein
MLLTNLFNVREVLAEIASSMLQEICSLAVRDLFNFGSPDSKNFGITGVVSRQDSRKVEGFGSDLHVWRECRVLYRIPFQFQLYVLNRASYQS